VAPTILEGEVQVEELAVSHSLFNRGSTMHVRESNIAKHSIDMNINYKTKEEESVQAYNSHGNGNKL